MYKKRKEKDRLVPVFLQIMERIYKKLVEGKFLDRPNRFVCHAEVAGEKVLCHMPNPAVCGNFSFPA